MPIFKLFLPVALFAFLGFFHTASATDYNYLPADVLIKQQQEKSALEYRIRSLESQLSGGNPSVLLNDTNYRISTLESERDTEINYIKGIYAQRGIGNQAEAKVAEINAKYASQISELERQKASYQKQVDAQREVDREIEKIQKQLKEIDAYYDKLRDDVLKQAQSQTMATPSVYLPDSNDPNVIFRYLDSLTAQEASNASKELLRVKPQLYDVVLEMWLKAYPNGKVGTAMYSEYVESLKQATPAVSNTPSPKPSTPATETKQVVVETEAEPVATSSAIDTGVYDNQRTVETPVVPAPEKKSFVQKVSSFFKSLMFWKK